MKVLRAFRTELGDGSQLGNKLKKGMTKDFTGISNSMMLFLRRNHIQKRDPYGKLSSYQPDFVNTI